MQITNNDKKIFEEIEQIREEIKLVNKKVEFLDFGAGSPSDARDKETMVQGVSVVQYTNELCQIGLKEKWACLMYSLVKKNQPKTLLELGTCCGFSAIYMAKASPKTVIYTIEGACEIAKLASENIKKANVKNIIQVIGKFDDVLDQTLERIGQLEFVFIDGHHDKDATLRYFKQIKPYLSKNAIVVFDDISWSEGMKEAWRIIIQDFDINKYDDFEKLGVCYFK